MMKKLLMWSALLMTGFAFYSCDDVVDNPVQDTSAVWNYAVNVKFADFDLSPLGINPETNEPYAYEAPKTLYVFNEQLQPLGEITTEKAPAAGVSAKYSGTLHGAIGDNLIILTKTGVDYAKQDGTIESVVENGIVQMAKVPVRIYSNYNYNVSTEDAKMENATAITHLDMGWLNADDEIAITSDNIANENKSFTIKIGEDTNVGNFFVAIPTDAAEAFNYSFAVNAANGEIKGAEIEDLQLEKGKINELNPGEPYHIAGKTLGVDLTKWDAYMLENDDNYAKAVKNGEITNYWYNDNNDYSFIITQSGEKAIDHLRVDLGSYPEKEVSLTLNNVRLGKNCSFGINDGATFDITLIGENKFDGLNLNSPFTKKGTGTWEFNMLNVGGAYHFDGEGNMVVDFAAEYTISEDIDLKSLNVYGGGELTIADGKTVNVTCDIDNERAVNIWLGTLNIGKAAKLNAKSTIKERSVVNVIGNLNIGENAEVNVNGAKDNTAMYITDRIEDWSAVDWQTVFAPTIRGIKSSVNIGKNAKINLVGAPSNDSFGTGINIEAQKTTVELNLEEGATVKATSVDRTAFRCIANDEEDNANPVININIAKNAKIQVEDLEGGTGLEVNPEEGTVNFDGAGTLEAKSKSSNAMNINAYNNTVNFKGGTFLATCGSDNPAININGTHFIIGEKITSLKATTSNPIYIFHWIDPDNQGEAKLENIVADKTKFTDTTADGVRTITPKAPAE